jgi:hypothetical protein
MLTALALSLSINPAATKGRAEQGKPACWGCFYFHEPIKRKVFRLLSVRSTS